MKKILSIIICYLTILTVVFTPITAFAETIDESYLNEFFVDSQGLDEYVIFEESLEDWYNNLPSYSGKKIESKIESESLKKLDFSNRNEEISISVISIQKNRLYKNSDERFKLWKDSDLTPPIVLYNFDNSIYGYMYGIVDKNNKLVGYIVAGANPNAPPILEYSLYADRYLALQNKEKIYFSSDTGYIISENNKLYNAIDNTPCDVKILDTLWIL